MKKKVHKSLQFLNEFKEFGRNHYLLPKNFLKQNVNKIKTLFTLTKTNQTNKM